jgi:hypothetical protein
LTFEQYLSNGGDREEKLVVIWKTEPERLSTEYRALFTIMESKNHILRGNLRDHDLYYHLQNWDRIRSDLEAAGAEFV